LGDPPFLSDRSEASFTKRWAWIQKQTTKFNAAYEKMMKHKVSGLGVADLMTQSLGQFNAANEQKNFNLVHCWTTLKDCSKWHDLYASYDANAPGQPNVIDVDGEATSAPMKRPRGLKISKAEAKREASSQAMMEMINMLIADKEVSSEKREERKRQEKGRECQELLRDTNQEARD
jgi:hypothetical protein